MNFNSWQYLIFFPAVLALNYALTARPSRHGVRLSQCLLLAASLFFYGCWNPAYLGLILFSVAVTWVSGLLMEGRSPARKRLVLACSLVLNLGILFFFKYYGLFAGTLARFASVRLPSFNLLLPVGISFYTFQALGYSIDVYRGTVKAERDFLTYALFVTFFGLAEKDDRVYNGQCAFEYVYGVRNQGEENERTYCGSAGRTRHPCKNHC